MKKFSPDRGFLTAFRQWMFLKPLQIADFKGEQGDFALPEVKEMWKQLQNDLTTPAPETDTGKNFIKVIANTFWKLKGEVSELEEWLDRFRNRLLQWDTQQKKFGVQIEDLSGQPFDHGEDWEHVVSDGTHKTEPFIVKMQNPRIRFRGDVIQIGTPVVEDRAQTKETP